MQSKYLQRFWIPYIANLLQNFSVSELKRLFVKSKVLKKLS